MNKLILAGALILVFFIIAVFLFAPNPLDFEIKKLNELSASAGLEAKPLNQQSQELFELPNDRLVFLKNDLQKFNQQTTNEQTKALSSLYADLAHAAFLYKTTFALNNSVDSTKDFCTQLETFRQINENIAQLQQTQEKISAKINDFVRKNPQLAEQVQLYFFKPSTIGVDVQEKSKWLELAGDAC